MNEPRKPAHLQLKTTIIKKGSIMKSSWTALNMLLAASLLALEAQAGDFARVSRPTASMGNTNVSTISNFRQGNLNSSALRSSSQNLSMHNNPAGSTKLAPLSPANKFNAVAAKNLTSKINLNNQSNLSNSTVKSSGQLSSGQLLVTQNSVGNLTKLSTTNTAKKFNAIASKNLVGKLNLHEETTTGIKDPQTGRDLSKNANPGFGLPGGKNINKEFPSAEQQWNDRIHGALGGGSDYLSDGTPFDDKPGSSPLDDFLGQYGANIPDPLAGQGNGRAGYSPAQDAPIQDSSNGSSVTVGEITFGSSYIICASDFVSPKDSGAKTDECIEVQYDRDDGFKTDTDRKMAVDFWLKWGPKGTNDQQYEGEGGYTGGSGHSINDLYIGSVGRMTGKVVGGTDMGEAGLGKDTGSKLPANLEAIGNYVSRGGKAHGKGGFQNDNSGLGQDIGGAAENTVSRLKKAIDAQRFVVDPDARSGEEIPWWMREKVSPLWQASASQLNAEQVGLQQGVAAQQKETEKNN